MSEVAFDDAYAKLQAECRERDLKTVAISRREEEQYHGWGYGKYAETEKEVSYILYREIFECDEKGQGYRHEDLAVFVSEKEAELWAEKQGYVVSKPCIHRAKGVQFVATVTCTRCFAHLNYACSVCGAEERRVENHCCQW